jgi:hypothetical protein
MTNQQVEYLIELIKLVQTTGDRCLVMPIGDNNNQPLVLLRLAEYKQLLTKQDSPDNSRFDDFIDLLRSFVNQQHASIIKETLDSKPINQSRINKNDAYTNIEEFEVKRRLYADLVDGFKSEPLFQ